MTKKIICIGLVILFAGLMIATLPALDLDPINDLDPNASTEGGDGDSGGTMYYVRQSWTCDNNPKKKETHCYINGNELCSPRYCD